MINEQWSRWLRSALSGGVVVAISAVSAYAYAYEIGQKGPAGGWVFYITEDGLHGLEAATMDQGKAEWGCWDKIVRAEGTVVGTGAENTRSILAECPTAGIAARVADDYVSSNGDDDWFLPSKDELKLMYRNLHLMGLGGFVDNKYWSSTEASKIGAWHQYFYDDLQSDGYKANLELVRAVRAF